MSVVDPLMPLSVAVMLVLPMPCPIAWPVEPAAFEIDATPINDDVQFTEFVRSIVVPSVSVPVAMNCSGGRPWANSGWLESRRSRPGAPSPASRWCPSSRRQPR